MTMFRSSQLIRFILSINQLSTMLQCNKTHFGDVSRQRHSSNGFMLHNRTIFDNELQNCNQQNFHQKSGPGWIQRAETKNLPRYKMIKRNQQTEQQQQQHNCPGVLRSQVPSRFRNPFSAPHITTPSQREEKNCWPKPADLHWSTY